MSRLIWTRSSGAFVCSSAGQPVCGRCHGLDKMNRLCSAYTYVLYRKMEIVDHYCTLHAIYITQSKMYFGSNVRQEINGGFSSSLSHIGHPPGILWRGGSDMVSKAPAGNYMGGWGRGLSTSCISLHLVSILLGLLVAWPSQAQLESFSIVNKNWIHRLQSGQNGSRVFLMPHGRYPLHSQ